MLDHQAPDGALRLPSTDLWAVEEPHPDKPERAENIKHMIEVAFGDDAQFETIEPLSRTAIETVHEPEYIDWVKTFSESGGGRIEDTTSGANEATYDAARYAASAALTAACTAYEDEAGVHYALCRPSGHHAQTAVQDGFCFFNNAAIATEEILSKDADRIAVIDWDLHHGNGVQEIFYNRDDVLYISIHNDHGSWDPDHHPQEGSLKENGTGTGEGYNINIPVPPGTGDRGYEYIFDRIVEPIVDQYNPDFLLACAGQDPGVSDPLGRNLVTRLGFREMAIRFNRLAEETAKGRYAIIQEGGYQVSHLPIATLGVLEGALNTQVNLEKYGTDDPFDWLDETFESTKAWIDKAVAYHSNHWSLESTKEY